MMQIAMWEFYMYAGALYTVPVLVLLIFFVFRFTPAKIFLKAWLTKRPVAEVMYKTGFSDFKVASVTDAGSMEVDGVGIVNMSENSSTIDQGSKVPLFRVFSEFALSIPNEYGPIIQELRELGFKIKNFKDYHHVCRLATDAKYADKIKKKITSDTEKAKFQEQLDKLKKIKIEVRPLKTYKMHDLMAMFPYNISPAYIDQKVQAASNRKILRDSTRAKAIVYVAIAVLIIIIALIVFWKGFMGDPNCPACVCQVSKTGLETVKAMASNATI